MTSGQGGAGARGLPALPGSEGLLSTALERRLRDMKVSDSADKLSHEMASLRARDTAFPDNFIRTSQKEHIPVPTLQENSGLQDVNSNKTFEQ